VWRKCSYTRTVKAGVNSEQLLRCLYNFTSHSSRDKMTEYRWVSGQAPMKLVCNTSVEENRKMLHVNKHEISDASQL